MVNLAAFGLPQSLKPVTHPRFDRWCAQFAESGDLYDYLTEPPALTKVFSELSADRAAFGQSMVLYWMMVRLGGPVTSESSFSDIVNGYRMYWAFTPTAAYEYADWRYGKDSHIRDILQNTKLLVLDSFDLTEKRHANDMSLLLLSRSTANLATLITACSEAGLYDMCGKQAEQTLRSTARHHDIFTKKE